MVIYLLEMFGASLALTVAVELVVVYFLLRLPCAGRKGGGDAGSGRGEQKVAVSAEGALEEQRAAVSAEGAMEEQRKWVLLVVLINVLTNPPAVLLCWLGRIYLPTLLHFPLQIAVEAVVVVTEAYVYRSFAGSPGWRIKSPVLLSVVANGCSWLVGMLFMLHIV